MKSANENIIRLLSVLSLSSLLFLTVSAQTDETNSTVTGKTNSTDAMAIQLLVDTFSFTLAAMSLGDPCQPGSYLWVTCSSDDTPRITEIDLGANILLGGEFPDFLANFPKLKVLYLVGTSIYGTVPMSLKKRLDNKTLQLMLPATGLCFSDEAVCPAQTETGTGTRNSPGTDGETSPGTVEETSTTNSFTPTRTKSSKKKTVPIALGTGIPIFVIFWAVVGFLAINHQKGKAAAAAGKTNGNLQDLEGAAENILPDDQGVNTDRQTHPTV
ncbi:uncharacterized protein LOC113308892 isoform X2 [Papaver somniferum]|uniref:uncharacterized protein LOC113308892 isoform X2 n=1 Tax=Papaver somniferum TaxID=3469 RepID=UPI000E6FA293|nr:uncharacterized protein LOC113308892 isoform X2 [Papaver somniferum]